MTTLATAGYRHLERSTAFLNKFFFAPASARPLAVLRIGLALLLLWQAYLMNESFLYFFADTGFVQGEVSQTLSDPTVPRLNWLVQFMSSLGVSEKIALSSVGLFYVISLLLLLCGFFTRGAALVTWFLHWALLNTGYSGAYGADMYAHFLLFYLVWIPSGDDYSFDRLFGRTHGEPTYQARLGLRVLQLHMCISYLASGLEKATGIQWWNGEVLWRALNTPSYSIGDFHWFAQFPLLPMVGGWMVMIIEIFYIIMIWPRRSRYWWIAATCLLHLGIAIFLTLPVFGVLMCIPTLALFAVSDEPTKALSPGT